MENQERTSAIITKGSNQPDQDRTFIVFSVMRGGTTMVAGLMRALGIFMGDEINENNQESMSFNSKSHDDMRAKINTLNQSHAVWG